MLMQATTTYSLFRIKASGLPYVGVECGGKEAFLWHSSAYSVLHMA